MALPTRTPPALPPTLPDAALPTPDHGLEAPTSLQAAAQVSDRPAWWRRFLKSIGTAIDYLFGLAALIAALAILSVIPILNFLSLGYLLEVSGRIARSGRLRDGFVGVQKASILGRMLLGAYLFFLPLRLVSGLWQDAAIIAPESATAGGWRVALIVLSVLVVAHVTWACLRGGRIRHFLWPAPVRFVRWMKAPGQYEGIRDRVLNYLRDLRLPYYFWLGARGFAGAVAWLIAPVGILFVAAQLPDGPAFVLSLVGSLALAFVILYLPFLQARFARDNRFRSLFEWREVRAEFRRAPVAFWFALFITLLFAIPLYLLKIELTPAELTWLPALFFVLFIAPARMLTGWALGRAGRRETSRFWLMRWAGRLAAVPVVLTYAFIVYVSQYLSWSGSYSLLEQHAFLVPAPFVGL